MKRFTLFSIVALHGALTASTGFATPELEQAAVAIERTLQEHVFDKSALTTPAATQTLLAVRQLAADAADEATFIAGFNGLWQQGPFSHVQLGKRAQSPQAMADWFDAMEVGGQGASLRFDGGVAILIVSTMMGRDTLAQIDAAYDEIAAHAPEALIIDLRNNPGGAFAVKPLVSHLLTTGFDAGVFLSQQWNRPPPSADYVASLQPWQGWTLQAFWHDVQANAVTRIRFEPAQPHYAGKVYVLVSHATASAAELAAAALQDSQRAMLIGEVTAGMMLSQQPYDVNETLQLMLPFADYVAAGAGRIEGRGVKPDIEVPADQALERALLHVALAAAPPTGP